MSVQVKSGQSSPSMMSEIYYLVFRHKWKILIPSLLGVVTAGMVYLNTPSIFQSESKLIIRYITEATAVDPEATGNRMMSPDRGGRNIINTEMHILTSQDVIESVVQKIGPEKFAYDPSLESGLRRSVRGMVRWIRRGGGKAEPPAEQTPADVRRVAATVLQGLTVDNPLNSNIIRVSMLSYSPSLAKLALDELVDAYMRKHFEIHRAVGAYAFLAQQVDQARSRLAETEDELRKLKAQIGFDSIDEAKETVTKHREEIEKQVWDLEGQLAGILAKRQTIQGYLGQIPEASGVSGTAPSTPLPQVLQNNRLSTLKKRESELLSIYTENSIPILNLREQIEKLESQLGTPDGSNAFSSVLALPPVVEDHAALNETLLTEDAEAAALRARIAEARRRLETIQQRELKGAEVEARITELQRKKEIEEANYRYFSQGLERARIDDALDAEKLANISVVQPATFPSARWMPRELYRRVFAILAFGFVFGFGLAFVSEKVLDHSLRRPAEVELAVDAPMLISIPQSIDRRHRLMSGRGGDGQRLLPAHAGPDGMGGASGSSKGWTIHQALTPYYETLRDRVLASMSHRIAGEPCMIGVTSCAPGSGSTTLAAGLALSLARNGDGHVLFMDASHVTHQGGGSLFGDASNAPIADIAMDQDGKTTIIQPNLYVLSAEEVTSQPPGGVSGGRIEDVLDKLRHSNYDFIVFDMPPISETSPALRIAHCLSGVVLVIRAGKVPRATARKARRLLDQVHAHVIGTILNGRRHYVPEWLDSET